MSIIEKYGLESELSIIKNRVIENEYLKEDIVMILSMFPDTKKIYQAGSIISGMYLDKRTTKQEYKAIRRFYRIIDRRKKCNKHSDRDYVLFPTVKERTKIGEVEILTAARVKKEVWSYGDGF